MPTLTAFLLPDEPCYMLAQTRSLLLEDMRVAIKAVEMSEQEGFASKSPSNPGTNSSAVEKALRYWRHLLPNKNAGDSRTHRLAYGWTLEDIGKILRLGDRIQAEMTALQEHVMLSGTAITLERDREKVVALMGKWADLAQYRGDV